MNADRDESLALAAQAGDKNAAQRLLEKYKNAVRGAARSYFLEGGDAEDLVQEGMIGLYNAITDYREGGMSFKNFAYLCINRRIRTAVRSATRKKHTPLNRSLPLFDADGQGIDFVSPDDPESALLSEESRAEFLLRLKEALSEGEYAALALYMEGRRIAEIAAERGIGEKSAENAVQRAKRKAARLLCEQGKDEN